MKRGAKLPPDRQRRVDELAAKYTMEYCEVLLRMDPMRAASRLYDIAHEIPVQGDRPRHNKPQKAIAMRAK